MSRRTEYLDILTQKKREVYLNTSISKDASQKKKESIRRRGFNAGFMEQFAKRGLDTSIIQRTRSTLEIYNYSPQIVLIGSIKVNGYSYSNLTPAELLAFKNTLAAQLGVNPNLITLVLRSGSLIIDISVNYANVIFSQLSTGDKSFFANSDSIISSVTLSNVSDIITAAGTSSKITLTGGPVTMGITISTTSPSGSSDYQLKQDCISYLKNGNKAVVLFNNPLVGDYVNDCMYTIVDSDVVKIDKNGIVSKIATFPGKYGCKYIFMNSILQYLVIPYYSGVDDLNSKNNLIYLVKLGPGSGGTIYPITLTDFDSTGSYGFEPSNERLYYCSSRTHLTNPSELCYIDIRNYTINGTLSATFGYSNLMDIQNKGKLVFIGADIGFYSIVSGICRFDLSSPGGIVELVVGGPRSGDDSGYWNNLQPAKNSWYNNLMISGPFLDENGTDAFLSWAFDISIDQDNLRLIVCDMFAQRIRAIDLTPKNNPTYKVTTLAGYSPVKLGVAGTTNTSSYTQNVLNSLGQVGAWNNGINDMPIFTKKNAAYLTSTFKYPVSAVYFNNKIFVRTLDSLPVDDLTLITDVRNPFTYCTVRQLYNDQVSDFVGIKNYGTQLVTVPTFNTYSNQKILLGTIVVDGYDYSPLTSSQLDIFTRAFANYFRVNPLLLVLQLTNSLIIEVYVNYANVIFDTLTDDDKVFFINSDSILSSITVHDISNIIYISGTYINIQVVNTPAIRSVSIANKISTGDSSYKLKTDCITYYSDNLQLTKNFTSPFVGDSINNVLYTVVPSNLGSYLAKINSSGIMTKVCYLPTTGGCRQLFISKDSKYLICPSDLRDVSSTLTVDNIAACGTIFLINISSKIVTTITLTELSMGWYFGGFDQSTGRFYYASCMAANYRKLCYVSIPSDYSSATLSPTIFKDIGISGSVPNMIFLDSKTALISSDSYIRQVDLSDPNNGSWTIIAGIRFDGGGWSNSPSGWNTSPFYSPYVDANNGTDASFTAILAIVYDPSNQRLLVCDYAAQRIRSVDLKPGNNYAVTTLAGRSPTTLGLAINANTSTYSQDLLDSWAQVGLWGQGNMPIFTKNNDTYITSTFNNPISVYTFNQKIYVTNFEGRLQSLSNNIVSDFSIINTAFTPVTVTATILNGGTLGSIKVIGYTLGTIRTSDTDMFKQQFSMMYGVSPDLINVTFTSGSLIINFNIESNINQSTLSLSDKSFFANSDAIIRGVQTEDIVKFISDANIPNTSLNISGNVTIDTSYTNINLNLDISLNCKKDKDYQRNLVTSFQSPFVGDSINDCMYTIVYANDVVRVNKSGTMNKIATFPNNLGCLQIFINANSTYLIIPSNESDTTMPGVVNTDLRPSKVYLVNILTGVINTITLAESNNGIAYGYDKLTRKFYYSSNMANSYLGLAYITIPSDFSSATLSPTYTSLLFSSSAKLEFVDSNTAYTSNGFNIQKYDLSTQTATIIAGRTNPYGGWSNDLVGGWNSTPYFGPFLDANIGTNAHFSLCSDVCYDSANQRLLVTDYGAQRIRSVDLRAGNNYAVTTLAGTSPLNIGLAINVNGTRWSQGVLDSLAQVGLWGIGIMPKYQQINGTYLTSTFNIPTSITIFNKKIYVLSGIKLIQLSNGYTSEFSSIRLF